MATIRLYLSSKQQKVTVNVKFIYECQQLVIKCSEQSPIYMYCRSIGMKKGKDNDSTYSCKRARRFD